MWLDLRNYKTDRLKRSLDARHAKYTVARILSPVIVKLIGILSNIYPIFYIDLLRPASQDLLLG